MPSRDEVHVMVVRIIQQANRGWAGPITANQHWDARQLRWRPVEDIYLPGDPQHDERPDNP